MYATDNNEKSDLKEAVIAYIEWRKKQAEYTGWLGSLAGIPGPVKISAAEKLLNLLNGNKKEKFTEQETAALHEPVSKLQYIYYELLEIMKTDANAGEKTGPRSSFHVKD